MGNVYNAGKLWNLLAGATATGAGATFDIPTGGSDAKSRLAWTWTVITTGTPTAVTTNLEGSIDGTNWFTLDSSTAITSEMRHLTNKAVLHVRANVATLTGGSSPTVSVALVVGG